MHLRLRFFPRFQGAALFAAQSGTAIAIAFATAACGAGTTSSSPLGEDPQTSGHAGTTNAGAGGSAGGAGGVGAGGKSDGGDASSGAAGAGSGGRGGAGGASGGGTGGTGQSLDTASVCPGAAPPTGPLCRSSSDCKNGGFCMASQPTGAALCGTCFPTTHQCKTDTDCDASSVCVADPSPDPCQCMGPDTACAPKCTASSCAADQTCGADGHCGPKSCADGFVCAAGTVCDTARATGHGCAPARCDFNETSCGAEEVCDPAATSIANHCRSKRCSEGVVCATNYRCDSATDYCKQLTCQTDGDCDCGACVQGACQPRLFMCVMQAA